MRNLGLRASAIVLASLLLLLSCEQVFTWPALAQAARPEVELPADLSLAELSRVAEYALQIGDRDLASAVLPLLLDRLAPLEGDALIAPSLLCGRLALFRSGISSAVTRAALIMQAAGEAGLSEAQAAAFEAARSSVSLDETGMRGLAAMYSLDPEQVGAANIAYMGTAFALSTLEGRRLSDLSTAEVDAIEASDTYTGGMLLLMQAMLMYDESGADASIIPVMAALTDFSED